MIQTGGLLPVNGGMVVPWPTGGGDPDPDPPTGAFPDAWDAMIATRDWDVVEATFDSYTGYAAGGYAYGDLVDNGGTVRSTHDGQVIEGVRGSALQIIHNDVTVRGCLFGPGNTYGFDNSPRYNWHGYGGLVEHCTFDGTIGSGGPVDKAAIIMQASQPNAVTFRFCEFRGWSSGALAQGGTTIEYSWFTDFYGSSVSGAHVSSLNARGSNVRFYRNLATEGGSPIASIYFDVRPVHNVEIRENLLTARLSASTNLPSYLLFGKSGEYRTPATGIVVGGNYFGDTIGLDYQFGLESGLGSVRWGVDGNVRTPNIDFLTGNPV